MVNPSICAPCRMRKVRCDSQQPECGQCLQARRMFQCTYDAPTSKATRDNLRKGEACMPCRRKKKKCDAAQPICDRCSSAGIDHECFYKERTPHKSPVLKENTTISLDAPQIPSFDTFPTSAACSPSPSGGNPQYAFPVATAGLQYSVNAVTPDDLGSASPLNPNPPNAQIPNSSLADLNMSFRLTFLSHREQLGIYLPYEKQQAIIYGDMSNARVHPFFIHFAHAVGCHFHQARRADFSMRDMQSAHLTVVHQILQQMKEEDDPFVYGQAHHYLAVSALYTQGTSTAIAYHEEAVKIVERNGLHIIKTTGDMILDPAHVEAPEVLERVVLLGTLLHMEIALDLLGAKKRTLCYTIEEEFRYKFPKVFPFLFQFYPSILRVQSAILVKDASTTIDSAVKPGAEVGVLANTCVRLIHLLTSHIDGLAKTFAGLSNEDHGSAVLSRSSHIESLAALAEMFDLMSRISLEPLATDYRRQCIETLTRAVGVIQGLRQEDFHIIEVFLGISLKRFSTLLNSTINRLYRTPIEGIDFDSLSSATAVLAEAKEWMRAAFHSISSSPTSLALKLSESLI